jgi:hypothetical protein
MAMVAGVPLDGAAATSVACLMLLVFGLPHGTLDLELIKTQSRGPRTGLAALLIVYLGCAALMLALWLVAPVIALGAFILIATEHFSEDWEGTGSRFLELGLALALLAGPTLFHRAALDEIFTALTGQSEATMIADLMFLVTPLALVVAAAALTLTAWRAPLVVTDANSGDVRLGGSYAAGVVTGGTAHTSRGLELDLGNAVNFTPLLGGEFIDLTARTITGTAQLFLTAAQEVTFMGTVKANTTTTMSLEHGSVAGAIVGIHMAAAQLINPSKQEINGRRLIGFDVRSVPVAGIDDLIIYTK